MSTAPDGYAIGESLPSYNEPKTEGAVRQALAAALYGEVAAMNLENFVVRPQRRLVEKFAKPDAWKSYRVTR